MACVRPFDISLSLSLTCDNRGRDNREPHHSKRAGDMLASTCRECQFSSKTSQMHMLGK